MVIDICFCMPLFLVIAEKILRIQCTRNIYLFLVSDIVFSGILISVQKLVWNRTLGQRLSSLPVFSERKSTLLSLILIGTVILSGLIIRWSEMPKYTGDLTVKEAVANFNDYNNYYGKYPYIELMPDGTFRKKEGYVQEDFYVFSDEQNWPRIYWKKDGDIVTGAEVKISSEAETGSVCPAYTDLLYLLTKALCEKEMHWCREKGYRELLKKLVVNVHKNEFVPYQIQWSAGTAKYTGKIENGSYNAGRDGAIGENAHEIIKIDITYSLDLETAKKS